MDTYTAATYYNFNTEWPVFVFKLTPSGITKQSYHCFNVFWHNPQNAASLRTVSGWNQSVTLHSENTHWLHKPGMQFIYTHTVTIWNNSFTQTHTHTHTVWVDKQPSLHFTVVSVYIWWLISTILAQSILRKMQHKLLFAHLSYCCTTLGKMFSFHHFKSCFLV